MVPDTMTIPFPAVNRILVIEFTRRTVFTMQFIVHPPLDFRVANQRWLTVAVARAINPPLHVCPFDHRRTIVTMQFATRPPFLLSIGVENGRYVSVAVYMSVAQPLVRGRIVKHFN